MAGLSFGQKEITLVIDPGHGGKDPGNEARFSGHEDEKDLNLKIATYLGGYIEKYLQHVKVVYTRTDDSYPTLDQRVDKANGINADYFISIHCNGNDNPNVRGTESIIHDMRSTVALDFAKKIERQFSRRAGRKSRGVKNKEDLHHSIQVLKYTKMPSVLVECGFMTNRTEANYLNSTYGQEILASAIFRAFRSFIQGQHPGTDYVRKSPNTNAPPTGKDFAIQIMSSKNPVDTDSPQFKKLGEPVRRVKLNTSSPYKYIYTVGNYASRKLAKNALPKIQSSGFSDAFVVRR